MGNCAQSLCDKGKSINVPLAVDELHDNNDARSEDGLRSSLAYYPQLAKNDKMIMFLKLQGKIKAFLTNQKYKKILRQKKNTGLGYPNYTSASKEVMLSSNIHAKVDIKDASDPRNLQKDDIRRRFKQINIEPHKIYEGEWLNCKRDGIGKLRWNDGSVYTGYFRNDKACGFGKLIHADGDIYLGYWEDDRAHGIGKYNNNRGASYEGLWACDKQNGYGNEYWPKGSNFEGDYVDGAKHGHGILNLEDNACYKGQFRDNDINGIGTFYFKDNRKYEGEWKYNKMYGYGILSWPDGKFFEGYFINDKKEGFGVYYAISKIYIGNCEIC